ncbi:hypothetical protein [Candidatus Lokiarchaeum ossiferum]|uniref:hypothetical protein n=1 Tax=Candidatus Lokiarchaeum ossiferum TaxID=2951803 RepID=UPI00352D6357
MKREIKEEENKEGIISSFYNIIKENLNYYYLLFAFGPFVVIMNFSRSYLFGFGWFCILLIQGMEYFRQKKTLQWLQLYLDIFRWQSSIEEIVEVNINQASALLDDDFAQLNDSNKGEFLNNGS